MDRVIDFLQRISELDTKMVEQYMRIIGIDASLLKSNLCNWKNVDHLEKFIEYYILHTKFVQTICSNCLRGNDELVFLEKYSDEQIKYITYPEITNTKLIACAGSGKTRSIIGRIRFMVKHGLVSKEEVFAITFSKPAATDFHKKITTLYSDYETFASLKNFSTIDSLAKSILCRVKSHKSNNVEILSISLRNFLQNASQEELETIYFHKRIKHLFVDEAQDLNQSQYDLIMLLQKKLGTVIHLIGDPNQNIFQFRGSSSSYLMEFSGATFILTKNFRSTQNIINFSDAIKPIKTSKCVAVSNSNDSPVNIIVDNATNLHDFMIRFIKLYQKGGDISKIAIVCPTRGIKSNVNIGLSVFFNLFKLHNIPFTQLYEESGLSDERKKKVEVKSGHVNLLTYHGTKGLEFSVVFVMDFYHHLFNIKPTQEEHDIHRYLLYVVCSRAKDDMYICTYSNHQQGLLNAWLNSVPSDYYIAKTLQFKIAQKTFREDIKQPNNVITEIISMLTDDQLSRIDDIFSIEEGKNLLIMQCSSDNSSLNRTNNETLLGIFCEEFFYLVYYLNRKESPRGLKLIDAILNSRFIIAKNDSECEYLKKLIHRNKLTWNGYDRIRNSLSFDTINFIESNFSREHGMDEYVICTNEFINIVSINLEDIRKTYLRYLNSGSYNYNFKSILRDFFYLIVVMYGYDINHYYYLCDHGNEKVELLENIKNLLNDIWLYVTIYYCHSSIIPKVQIAYEPLNLIGEIDFVDMSGIEQIVEIKCVKEIGIKHYLQVFLYNLCYYFQKGEIQRIYKNTYKIINLLTGTEHTFFIKVNPKQLFEILLMVAETGHLKFNGLNLVFDLETNGLIQKNENKLMYPDILEIAIKDFDTGMIVFDTLCQPVQPLNPEITKITGLTREMLNTAPTMYQVKKDFQRITNILNICTFYGHNCLNFDRQILIYHGLIDPQISKMKYIDTLSLIPLCIDSNTKLESKSIENIHRYLFGQDYKAHRAMADVDALIKIMQKLRITL